MFLAVHALIGAVAGNAVSSPIAALSLGFISHFFTDMIPHGDKHVYDGYKTGNKKMFGILYVGGDVVLTVLLVSLVFIKQDFFHPVNVALGILGGLLPDLMAGVVELFKPKKRTWLNRKLAWFHGFHMLNHNVLIKHARHDKDIPMRYGLALQGVTLAALLKIIL